MLTLIFQLLELDPKKRLDFAGVREHSWFKDFDWKAIESQSLPRVPIIPVASFLHFSSIYCYLMLNSSAGTR